MKKWMKKLLAVCLVMALAVTALAPVSAKAATKTKKYTLYKGESFYLTNFSKVKSVSSTNKSVVKVVKDKKDYTHANIYAKKSGEATVTVKTSKGTMKYVITVKLSKMRDGYVLLSVKNNTKQTFDKVIVEYTLRDSEGAVTRKYEEAVYDVVAGKTAYDCIYYSSYSINPDISKSTAKVADLTHDPEFKYTGMSSIVTAKVKESGDKLAVTSKKVS